MKSRILVLDDEEVICEVIEEALAKQDYEVKSAYTGEEAIALIEKEAFDLLLVDLKLPTPISGVEVIKRFKECHPRSKVMVITGYPDLALEHEAERAGADVCLSKPHDLHPEKIAGHVKNVLGR